MVNQVQVAVLIDLRVRVAKRDDWPHLEDPKDFAVLINHSQIEAQFAFEIIGLLQDVLSDFGKAVRGSGFFGHPDLLLPQLGAINNIEILGRAGNFPAPLRDADGGNHVVMSRLSN